MPERMLRAFSRDKELHQALHPTAALRRGTSSDDLTDDDVLDLLEAEADEEEAETG